MYGLKNVRSRRDDALTRVGWEQLESLLAVYYRGQGYEVEHCGTGGRRARFDGGIDLKLREEGQYILVQCKHWNAKQVPHNDVHQLLGIMVNEGATGAILVTSGEFTKAAIEAATRQGHVQLIDGEKLRAMIGPLPEPTTPAIDWAQINERYEGPARDLARQAGERLFAAAEDRIRYGGRRQSSVANSFLWAVVLKFVFAAFLFLWLTFMLRGALASLTHPVQKPQSQLQELPQPLSPGRGYVADAAGSSVASPAASAASPSYHQPTKAEIREQQRKAAEAMKIIKDSTPEL
jgi:restriction system protein